MDEKRFKELFEDSSLWIQQARRLKIAGDFFTTPASKSLNEILINREKPPKQSPEFLNSLETLRSYSDARALLYGLSIENACKARLIQDGYIEIHNGKAKNLRSDHNILELVKQTQYRPTEEEAEYLHLLSYQIKVLAKYPIAKDVNTQSEFTGRAVGARPVESQIVHKIIIQVLKYERLIKIFEQGFNE